MHVDFPTKVAGPLRWKTFNISEVVDKGDTDLLINTTDMIRSKLRNAVLPSSDLVEDIETLLSMLSDVETTKLRIPFAIINVARLDKLLNDIINLEKETTGYDGVIAHANSLRRKWQTRFGGEYFAIDETRLSLLSVEGSLVRICLSPSNRKGKEKWLVTDPSPGSAMLGALRFQPGQWWLSLACAYRDGIVGNTTPEVTVGIYGVTAFPLVYGEEWDGEKPGEIVYNRKADIQDIEIPLLTEIGRTIRILRSYKLHSKYAPASGLRYDGLYTLLSWGLKLERDTNLYHSRMVFVREEHQRPLEEILIIPMPSQMDDWELYQRIKDDDTMKRLGTETYKYKRYLKEQKSVKREEWLERQRFQRILEQEVRTKNAQGERCRRV